MGKMARDTQRVSATAAAGSAILSTVVNIACGIAVAMVAGWRALDVLSQGHATAGFVLLALVVLGLATLPYTLPIVMRVGERLLNRPLVATTIPIAAVVYAIVGNVLAWLLYGLAFQWF